MLYGPQQTRSVFRRDSDSDDEDAPKAKRQKTAACQSPKRVQGDLTILQSGEFSDATLVINSEKIKIHKAVVVPRSGFFKGALAGKFKEAATGCITVEEFDVSQVKRTLHFIYGREFENEDSLTLAHCVDLIKLGDYFLVDGMVAHAAQLLWSRLSAILKITAQPTNGPLAVDDLDDPYANVAITDDTLLESGFASHFADAVKCAYGEDATPDNIGQKILADFVWSARVVLIGNPVIEALNGRFPAFGSHVFSVINKGPQSRVPATLEEEQRRIPKYIDPTSLELTATRAYCHDCVEKKEEIDKEWKPWPMVHK